MNESLYDNIVAQFEEAPIPTQINLIASMTRSTHEHASELINCMIHQQQANTSEYLQALFALSTLPNHSTNNDSLLHLIEHSFESLDAAEEFGLTVKQKS